MGWGASFLLHKPLLNNFCSWMTQFPCLVLLALASAVGMVSTGKLQTQVKATVSRPCSLKTAAPCYP